MDEVKKLIEEWVQKNKTKESLEDDLKKTKEELSEITKKILEASEGQRTFHHDGLWYNIRKRKGSGHYYICVMNKKPGSWLKKDKQT